MDSSRRAKRCDECGFPVEQTWDALKRASAAFEMAQRLRNEGRRPDADEYAAKGEEIVLDLAESLGARDG